MRTAVAVIAGFVVWTVIWLAGNAVLSGTGIISRGASEPIESLIPLGLLILLSVICSFVSGIVARTIDRENARGAGMILALLLLVVGLAAAWNFASVMPLWYHIVFLALVVPVTLLGAGWWRTPPGDAL